MSSMELGVVLDLGCSSWLEKFDFMSEIRLDTSYGDKWIRRIGFNFLGVRDKIKSIKIITINHIKCVSLTDEQLCIRRIGCSGYAGSGIDHYANQATIQDNKVTVQQVKRRQGQSYAGTSYKGNATSSREIIKEGIQGWLNVIIVKVKVTWLGNALSQRGLGTLHGLRKRQCWLKAHESSQLLDEEKLTFLADLGILDDVILEVPHFEPYHTDMDNQSVHAMQAHVEKMIDSQMDDMIKEKLALKQQIDSLEQNLSNRIKEKEYLLQTFIVFKNESKEKESKYMDKEIDLEKKIKEQDNIVYKVGQSAQTVHMLTKPQVFYDDTHKQALGYQNTFYLKKAQQIKPTLYDGSVISSQHAATLVIDDEET
ncbi:hypothetical protein Tco_0316703 [Tanacetum coccineum]